MKRKIYDHITQKIATRGKHMTTRSNKRAVNHGGWLHRDWRLYVMLILPVAFYLIFCYKPMVGVIIAFQKFNMFKGMWGSKWIGLENFKFVMGMPDFWPALTNTATKPNGIINHR